jgi:hypothetical protein
MGQESDTFNSPESWENGDPGVDFCGVEDLYARGSWYSSIPRPKTSPPHVHARETIA